MDGKKTIRNAIIAFIVVGVLGVGLSIYTQAVGVEGSLMENLLAQKQEEASLKDSAEEEDTATEEEEVETKEESSASSKDSEKSEDNDTDVSDAIDYGASGEIDSDTALETESTNVTENDALSETAADTTAEESNALETDTTTTDSTAVLREGPYYQYTVTADFGLNIYNAPDTPTGDSGKIGVVPAGTTGYVIGQGNRRTLIQYNGMFGYVSNTYVTLTEVSAEEYPEELKSVTWDNAVIGVKEGE